MKRRTDRILTTHTGSLPRPDDLLEMIDARERGAPYDEQVLQDRVRTAVAGIVRQQAEAGIDIVSDGEFGKPSFATYVRGHEGSGVRSSIDASEEGFWGTCAPTQPAPRRPCPPLRVH